METKKMSIGANSLIFSLILGLALIIFDLLFYIFNAPFDSLFKYLNLPIILAFIIYGTIYYRNKYKNGFITYGQSLLSCFLIALFSGIIFAVYEFLFLKFFDPSIVEKVQEFARQKMADNPRIGEDLADQIIEKQKWIYNPLFLSLSAIFNLALWGFVFSLIVSIFIKKQDTSFESATQNIENQ